MTEPFPALLWHYTSMAGLLGILESQTIWASDLHFLNDSSENKRMKEVLLRYIPAANQDELDAFNSWAASMLSAPSNLDASLRAPLALDGFGEIMKEVRELIDSLSPPQTFITCFSADGDSLSQWRGYGSGPGFAIGFDRICISKALIGHEDTHAGGWGSLPFLSNVRYLSEDDHTYIRELLYAALWSRLMLTYTAMCGVFAAASPFVKDASFADEKEWRICYRYVDQKLGSIRYRMGRSNLIPYVEIPVCLEWISEIRVGPGQSTGLNVEALKVMCRESGLTFRVTESKIPFRNS